MSRIFISRIFSVLSWSFYSVCTDFGAQHPVGAEIRFFQKSIWWDWLHL